MGPTQAYWKGGVDDLRARAIDVLTAPAVRLGQLTAAEAAHCLVGVMSWIQRRAGIDAMQRAAAELVRFDDAWSSSLGRLPARMDGTVDENVALMAVVCRGLLDLAGVVGVRSALSFWATETDPAVWRQLFAE